MNQRRRRNLKIDYHKNKYANPFFRDKKPHSTRPKADHHWKLKAAIALTVLTIALIIWFFFFSKVFIIKSIKINAPANIPSTDITSLIWQQTDRKAYLLASQKNIFLFDKIGLADNLKARYAIGAITINKKIPSTLEVAIKGKSVVLIWHEAGKYYYVFDDNSTTETDPLQIKDASLAVINNAGQSKIINGFLQEGQEKLTASIKLNTELKNNQHQLQIEGLINQDNQENTVEAKILNGPLLLFSTKSDLNMQINKLYAIINESFKANFSKIDHIDLRFGDNVYIK